mmetsp:Transcript_795/g.3287  ORF Transcript_795/g.3287 Transcript_795/m.3287 type:complete len:426 (-) Transcript_795:234-1511(-)
MKLNEIEILCAVRLRIAHAHAHIGRLLGNPPAGCLLNTDATGNLEAKVPRASATAAAAAAAGAKELLEDAREGAARSAAKLRPAKPECRTPRRVLCFLRATCSKRAQGGVDACAASCVLLGCLRRLRLLFRVPVRAAALGAVLEASLARPADWLPLQNCFQLVPLSWAEAQLPRISDREEKEQPSVARRTGVPIHPPSAAPKNRHTLAWHDPHCPFAQEVPRLPDHLDRPLVKRLHLNFPARQRRSERYLNLHQEIAVSPSEHPVFLLPQHEDNVCPAVVGLSRQHDSLSLHGTRWDRDLKDALLLARRPQVQGQRPAAVEILQRHLQLKHDVGGSATTTHAKELAQEICRAEALGNVARASASLQAGLAELVVYLPLLRVREHAIRLSNLLELLGVATLVRMVLLGHLSVGALHFFRTRIPLDI